MELPIIIIDVLSKSRSSIVKDVGQTKNAGVGWFVCRWNVKRNWLY